MRTRRTDGTGDALVVDAVISAVGQLNRPHLPEIPGRETFAGPAFHSAQWPAGLDLTGKRVAVIGTGASAAQFIPIVAEQAADVVIFQRTPAWFAPTPDYHAPVADGLRWLLPPRAVLQRMEPLLDLLDDGRRTAGRTSRATRRGSRRTLR